MTHISDCIDDWDVEGVGETMVEALASLRDSCEQTARNLDRSAALLREAAERYRAMQEIAAK
jgi:hypothetical protein